MGTPLCGLCRATLSGGGGLLAAGVNIVSRTLTGESPLQLSVTRGFIDVVESLLAAGANIETLDNEGATPLFWACDYGHLPLVERLLAAGASIDTQADDGETPLFSACRGGHTGGEEAARCWCQHWCLARDSEAHRDRNSQRASCRCEAV